MTTSLHILTNPDPRLRQRSEEVTPEELAQPETQAFLDELEKAMFAYDGVGIAAPQVGVFKRCIVVNAEGNGATVYCNPEILEKSFRTAEGEEGCLSVPGVYGLVKRHKRVTVRAVTRDAKVVTLELDGLAAVVWQHEIDHLNGVLFIDKITKYTKAGTSKL